MGAGAQRNKGGYHGFTRTSDPFTLRPGRDNGLTLILQKSAPNNNYVIFPTPAPWPQAVFGMIRALRDVCISRQDQIARWASKVGRGSG